LYDNLRSAVLELWRDNLDASGATIRMRIFGRGASMIVAPRQRRKRFV
jgi:hypothetical protein